MHPLRVISVFIASAFVLLVLNAEVSAQSDSERGEYVPTPGQAGKDVVWVPTPEALVEKMLDKAKVTAQDYVVDLGSGDGRNVIAAAKRGARATGFEYNPDMVALSRRNAERAGVADKATFVEGDMYEADFSDATVLALFLLPQNMMKLQDKFFNLKPGSRIVANTFGMENWEPDEKETETAEDCSSWCTVLLWIVPAKVAGVWKLPQGELTLTQNFQMISGTLVSGGSTTPLTNGRLRGNEISFNVGSAEYRGTVNGESMSGTVGTSKWSATRVSR